MSEEAPSEPEQTLRPEPEPEEKREEPVFNLGDLLKGRKGQQFAVGEVMAYAVLADIMDRREDRREERRWRMEQRANPQQKTPSPEVEAVKTQLSELQKTVVDLAETITGKEQTEAQQKFVEGVVQKTTGQILPSVQALQQRFEGLEQKIKLPEAPSPSESAEAKAIREELVKIADKIGESAGTKGTDITQLTGILDAVDKIEERLQSRIKKGEGEVDAKTMAISTVGEIGKELIGAYKDVATQSAIGFEEKQPETPASTMQAIIKRQVQNYITQQMQAGATTMNVQEAAKALGLTTGQVTWAYQQLMKEGWFHVSIPKQKGKVKETGQVQTGETEGTPAIEGESDQVFQPS